MRKTPVPRWMHRLFIVGAIFFGVVGGLSLWAGNWGIAVFLLSWGLVELAMWLTTEPRRTEIE